MLTHRNKILFIGASVAVIMLLFPPFKYPYHDFSGFHFALSPRATKGRFGAVDTSYLFMELAVVGIVTAAVFNTGRRPE